MRPLLKAVGIFAAVTVTGVIGLGLWLYFYTADLPATTELNEFNPASQTRTQLHSCDEVDQEITVVPKEKLGPYTVAALTAAEGRPRTQSPFIVSLLFPPADLHVATYQVRLAQTLVCTRHGSLLKRQ